MVGCDLQLSHVLQVSCFSLLQGLHLVVAERLLTLAPRPNLDANSDASHSESLHAGPTPPLLDPSSQEL